MKKIILVAALGIMTQVTQAQAENPKPIPMPPSNAQLKYGSPIDYNNKRAIFLEKGAGKLIVDSNGCLWFLSESIDQEKNGHAELSLTKLSHSIDSLALVNKKPPVEIKPEPLCQ